MSFKINQPPRPVQMGSTAVELGIIKPEVLAHICNGTVTAEDISAAQKGLMLANLDKMLAQGRLGEFGLPSKIGETAKEHLEYEARTTAKAQTAMEFLAMLKAAFPEAAKSAEAAQAKFSRLIPIELEHFPIPVSDRSTLNDTYLDGARSPNAVRIRELDGNREFHFTPLTSGIQQRIEAGVELKRDPDLAGLAAALEVAKERSTGPIVAHEDFHQKMAVLGDHGRPPLIHFGDGSEWKPASDSANTVPTRVEQEMKPTRQKALDAAVKLGLIPDPK